MHANYARNGNAVTHAQFGTTQHCEAKPQSLDNKQQRLLIIFLNLDNGLLNISGRT